MSLKLSLCCSILLSTFITTAQASIVEDFLSSPGALGDATRSSLDSHRSNDEVGGFASKISQEECYEQLDDLYHSWFSEIKTGEIYSALYSRTNITNENIEGRLNLEPDQNYLYGLTLKGSLEVGSYSPDTAVHLASNCGDYLVLNYSEIKYVDMRYPTFKDRKRTNIVNIQTKECRVTTASIDDLAYEIIACPGDNSIYTRFLAEEDRVINSN